MVGEWNEENWFDPTDSAYIDMDAGFDYEPSVESSYGNVTSRDHSSDPGDHTIDGVEEGSLSPQRYVQLRKQIPQSARVYPTTIGTVPR